MRPGVPFGGTSQSSAPVAFRQCGPVVLVHNRACTAKWQLSTKWHLSVQSGSSQYKGRGVGAAVPPRGFFSGTSQNHRRQRHSVDVALLCSFTTGCCARSQWGLSVQSASPQYKVAALSTKWELSVQRGSRGGCCAAWGAFLWDLAIIGASGISSMWPCRARSHQCKVAALSTNWQLSMQSESSQYKGRALGSSGQLWGMGSSGQLCGALRTSGEPSGALGSSGQLWGALGSSGRLWKPPGSSGDFAKASAPMAFRRCGPVVLIHNRLLCSFTMGAFSAKWQLSTKWQLSVQSGSSQYKVGALSTKWELSVQRMREGAAVRPEGAFLSRGLLCDLLGGWGNIAKA